ncbi:MAG: PAS domain S-box protein [Halobacteria archaeon]
MSNIRLAFFSNGGYVDSVIRKLCDCGLDPEYEVLGNTRDVKDFLSGVEYVAGTSSGDSGRWFVANGYDEGFDCILSPVHFDGFSPLEVAVDNEFDCRVPWVVYDDLSRTDVGNSSGLFVDSFVDRSDGFGVLSKEVSVRSAPCDEVTRQFLRKIEPKVLENIDRGYLYLDGENRVWYLNSRGEEILGVEGCEYVGSDIDDLFNGSAEKVSSAANSAEEEHSSKEFTLDYVGKSLEMELNPEVRGKSIRFRVSGSREVTGADSTSIGTVSGEDLPSSSMVSGEDSPSSSTEARVPSHGIDKERYVKEQILETSPVCILAVRPDGEIVYSNNHFQTVFESSVHEINSTELNPDRFSLSRNGERVTDEKHPVNLILERGSINGMEYSIDAGGETKYISVSGSKITDPGTDEDLIVLSVDDVTEQMMFEKDLSKSREIFEDLSQSIDDVLWVNVPNQDSLEYISPAYEDIWGRSVEEVKEDTENFIEGVHREDREKVNEALLKQRKGEETDIKYRVVQPDGEVRWVHDRGYPVMGEDGLKRIVGVASDITEMKKSKLRLQKNERALRRLYRTSSDTDLDHEERIEESICTGCERLGLRIGLLVKQVGGVDQIEFGYNNRALLDTGEIIEIPNRIKETARRTGIWTASSVENEPWDESDLRTYLVAYIGEMEGEERYLVYEGRPGEREGFTDSEKLFTRLAGDWIKSEIKRKIAREKIGLLQRKTQELIGMTDIGDIIKTAEECISGLVDHDYFGLHRYYKSENALTEFYSSGFDDLEVDLRGRDSPVWKSFVDGEPRYISGVYDEAESFQPKLHEEYPVRSFLCLPLGSEGVLWIGSETPDVFTDEDLEYLKILSRGVRNSVSRLYREKETRERIKNLEVERERLEKENHWQVLTDNISQDILSTDSLERAANLMCQKFYRVDDVRFVWCGRFGSNDKRLQELGYAGTSDGYLENVSFESSEASDVDEPSVNAAKDNRIIKIDDVSDYIDEPWAREALSREFTSVASVPLLVEDETFGVVSIYAEDSFIFEKPSPDISKEFGSIAGSILKNLEEGEIRPANVAVELVVEIRNFEAGIKSFLEDETSCDVEAVKLDGEDDDTVYVEFTADSDKDPADVIEGRECVNNWELLTEKDDSFFVKIDTSLSPLTHVIERYDCVLESISFPDRQTEIKLVAESDAEAKGLMGDLKKIFEVELISKMGRDPVEELEGLEVGLTERQEEILRTALYSGYFSRKRSLSGADLADSLDISPPTFHEHLRSGQHKILDWFFDRPYI